MEGDGPFPVKDLFHVTWENVWSPSMEPPLGWKAYYNGVHRGSPRGSFTTMLLLPEHLAAFCPILATLTWVDQSPISHCVLVSLHMVSPHNPDVVQGIRFKEDEVRGSVYLYPPSGPGMPVLG